MIMLTIQQKLSQKKNAITIVDDAHGDFVIGKEGKGTPEYFKVAKKGDLILSDEFIHASITLFCDATYPPKDPNPLLKLIQGWRGDHAS